MSQNNYLYDSFVIVGMPRHKSGYTTHLEIYDLLKHKFHKTLCLDSELLAPMADVNRDLSQSIELAESDFINKAQLEQLAHAGKLDCVIVIGGDGNFIRALESFSQFDIPLIGVNKGNLGFLTDIDPDQVVTKISLLALETANEKVTFIEKRNLLTLNNQQNIVNELSIHGSSEHRIIRLEVNINDSLAFEMIGDGLIVSTPTGSTAYNLSSGGPIVHPEVPAIIITPIAPHTLTSRPIVVPIDSKITIKLKDHNFNAVAEIINDGRIVQTLSSGNSINISASEQSLKLIHFKNCYNYYQLLAQKLG